MKGISKLRRPKEIGRQQKNSPSNRFWTGAKTIETMGLNRKARKRSKGVPGGSRR